MLGYEIELKSEEEIKELCHPTENGGLGQDCIGFDYGMLVSSKFYNGTVKLVGVTNYQDDMYAYMVENNLGAKTYVHLDWIGSINGNSTVSLKKFSSTMQKITNKEVIDPTTGHITPLTDLPMCSCGALGTTKLDNGSHICSDCVDKATTKQSYNYRPTYKFIGKQLTADKDTPVWYGLEVEVSTDKDKLANFAINNKDSIYLKSDGSIKGDGYAVEIVSMPHSFSELMKEGNWLDQISKLPTSDSDGNGTHVHISRTAFKDDRHYSLFYFLLHKMERIATKVGGRELTDYCSLSPTGKVHNKGNKATGNDKGRTVYLNEQGEHTVEARFFKGTTKTARLKAYVQLLESMIKYTRYHSKTVTSKGWFGYVTKKSLKYKELLEVLGNVNVDSLTDVVVFREPVKVTTTLNKVLIVDLHNIVEVAVGSRRFTGCSGAYVSSSNYLIFKTNGEYKEYPLSSITEIVYEKE